MRSVVGRNVVMRRIPVHPITGIKQLFETDLIYCSLLLLFIIIIN